MASIISDFDAVWIIHEYKHAFRNKTKMIWFSTEDIKMLYDYLVANGRSGARIYKGKYPNHSNFSRVNGAYDYRKEKTVVFMPTIYNAATRNHDDEIPKARIIEIVNEIENSVPSEFAFNHGELCPPNCGGDTVEDNT